MCGCFSFEKETDGVCARVRVCVCVGARTRMRIEVYADNSTCVARQLYWDSNDNFYIYVVGLVEHCECIKILPVDEHHNSPCFRTAEKV